MENWGENLDYEAQAIKDYEGRFTINFKKIYMDVDEISERTTEVTDTHPKDSLMKLWGGTMVGMLILFVCSYSYFSFVMLPFMAFYLVALFRISKCWKSFKYNVAQFWGMSIAALIIIFALSRGIQLCIGFIR